MHIISASPFTYLLLFLFTFQITALATGSSNANSPQLAPRQTTTTDGTTTTTTLTCDEYASIANLSTIGTNSTFRAAFQQASPFGTDKSSGILDSATKKFKDLNLINDTALNTQCGNLTAVAIDQAPKNFSMGIVGPFTFKVNEGIRNGRGMGVALLVAVATVGAAVLL